MADGASCTAADQCTSGVCSTFYQDADGDTYGNPNVVARVCGTSAPSGYVSNNQDCCDADLNAHPGQAGWFTGANGCGNFDYDCSGASEQEYTSLGQQCSAATGVCSQGTFACPLDARVGWLGGSVTGCGASANYVTGNCTYVGGSCCSGTCPDGSGCVCGKSCGPTPMMSQTQACH